MGGIKQEEWGRGHDARELGCERHNERREQMTLGDQRVTMKYLMVGMVFSWRKVLSMVGIVLPWRGAFTLHG